MACPYRNASGEEERNVRQEKKRQILEPLRGGKEGCRRVKTKKARTAGESWAHSGHLGRITGETKDKTKSRQNGEGKDRRNMAKRARKDRESVVPLTKEESGPKVLSNR